jgi:hypothetical protein
MATRREHLLCTAAIEAARSVMAHVLVRERRIGPCDMTLDEADAWQTLRDALFAERTARQGRGTA